MIAHRLAARLVLGGAVAFTLGGVASAGTVEDSPMGGESCQGQTATIVGAPGSEIVGTEGPDVVVTNGAVEITVNGGDDLVCVTGGNRRDTVDVAAGDGDDDITTSESQSSRARVDLGTGDDSFTGGARSDGVQASDPWASPRGQGADTVSTGGGEDYVVTGGSQDDPDHDAIDLGPGNDHAWLQGAVDPTLPVQGGTGSDQLELDRSTLRQRLVLDNAAGRATNADTTVLTWSAMERFRLTPFSPWEAPSFIGGPKPERIWTSVPFTAVHLGDGDDVLKLHLHGRLVDHASYVGGPGNDSFILNAEAGDQARRIELDLPRGQLLFRDRQQAVRADIAGYERYRFSSRRLDVRGSANADHVQWWGCHGLVAGGAGDDILETIAVADADCGYDGEHVDLVVRGGSGDDTLVGAYSPDTLLGGPGDDQAHGRRNTDRCRAETELSCEP